MVSARTHLEVITAHAHKDILELTASQVSAHNWFKWDSVVKSHVIKKAKNNSKKKKNRGTQSP